MGRVVVLAGLVFAVAAVAAVCPAGGDDVGPPTTDAAAVEGESPPAVSAPSLADVPWLAAAPAVARVAASGAGRPGDVQQDGGDVPAEEEKDTRRLLDLRMVLVDAESGQQVPAARCSLAGPERDRSSDGRRVRVEDPDDATDLAWSVQAPDGLLAWEAASASAHVSRYAQSLVAVYPLRHEADVEVTVAEADGGWPRAESLDVTVFAAGRDWSRPATLGRGSRLRLQGVPFFRGGSWSVLVSAHDGGATRTAGTGSRLPYDDAPVVARVVLPEEADPADEMPFEGWSRCGFGCGDACGRRAAPAGPLGRATIRVLRRDGSPAARAVAVLRAVGGLAYGGRVRTRSLTLDVEGRAEAGDLVPGAYRATVGEPGLVPFAFDFDVGAEAEVAVEGREPQGGDVLVVAVDQDGRPLPHVAVEVTQPSRTAWADLEGDVQRIDPYTDALGRRVLSHLEPGAVEVRGRYGDRRAKAAAVVEEGRSTPVRLVLE